MPDIPRLNGVIKALEEGKIAFVSFTPVDTRKRGRHGGLKSLDGSGI